MWLPEATYQLLIDQLAERCASIQRLESALELERHENRRAERHWANQLLRARASFPLQPAETPPVKEPMLAELVPVIDPGEREALVAAARVMNIPDPEREADRILREERGGF